MKSIRSGLVTIYWFLTNYLLQRTICRWGKNGTIAFQVQLLNRTHHENNHRSPDVCRSPVGWRQRDRGRYDEKGHDGQRRYGQRRNEEGFHEKGHDEKGWYGQGRHEEGRD